MIVQGDVRAPDGTLAFLVQYVVFLLSPIVGDAKCDVVGWLFSMLHYPLKGTTYG